jgi:DNA polymerase III subunit epsilon
MTAQVAANILPDHEAMVDALHATGQYRVLRRLAPRSTLLAADGSPTRNGLLVDVETTGLDPNRDEIVELAMVPFAYAIDGRIFRVGDAFDRLRQPACAIPAEVTALTGISNAMVAGKHIDSAEVEAFAGVADLVVAHNAAFDRRFLERFSELFAHKAWACSMGQVDWADEGFEGTKLGYLAMGAGFFYDRHRAVSDCHAAIELLAAPLPKTGRTGLSRLLQEARPTLRIWAVNSPFAVKDQLKERGYRWNGDGGASPKSWYVDVDEEAAEQELAYLRQEIYRREIELPMRRITAYERFSDRL